MRERMGALENQAEATWTSHHVTLVNEMKSVASDALENQRKSFFPVKQFQNFKSSKGNVTSILKNISMVFDTTCQKTNNKSKSNKLRVTK